MGKDKKRYVVQMDMYVYADNDYMARKYSHELIKKLDEEKFNTSANVTEIGEQPFASLDYRKLEDHSEPRGPKGDEPLPF